MLHRILASVSLVFVLFVASLTWASPAIAASAARPMSSSVTVERSAVRTPLLSNSSLGAMSATWQDLLRLLTLDEWIVVIVGGSGEYLHPTQSAITGRHLSSTLAFAR